MHNGPSYRRLPVYIVVDCSGSMNGDAIESVDQGFKNLIAKLMNDPYVIEIVWMSIIVFDSVPRQIAPLCPVSRFKKLPLQLGGASNLGKAFDFLAECMENEVRKPSLQSKGDWKPLVFLMTDGHATDSWETSVQLIAQSTNLIACGVGSKVDLPLLKKITEMVVLMKDMTREAFDQFIDFIGSTMTLASQRMDGRSDKIELQKKYDKIILG